MLGHICDKNDVFLMYMTYRLSTYLTSDTVPLLYLYCTLQDTYIVQCAL